MAKYVNKLRAKVEKEVQREAEKFKREAERYRYERKFLKEDLSGGIQKEKEKIILETEKISSDIKMKNDRKNTHMVFVSGNIYEVSYRGYFPHNNMDRYGTVKVDNQKKIVSRVEAVLKELEGEKIEEEK